VVNTGFSSCLLPAFSHEFQGQVRNSWTWHDSPAGNWAAATGTVTIFYPTLQCDVTQTGFIFCK